MKKRTLVAAIFDDAGSAVAAIHELRRTGFSDDQLGFVVRYDTDEHATNPLARDIIGSLPGTGDTLLLPTSEASIPMEEYTQSAPIVDEEAQNMPQKSQTRIIMSGIIGGTLGTVTTLLLPGIGPVVAGGTLAATLGVAIPTSMTPRFQSIGIPEHKAHHYEQQFQAGCIILTIKATEQQQEAQNILRYHRACSIEVH